MKRQSLQIKRAVGTSKQSCENKLHALGIYKEKTANREQSILHERLIK